MLDLGQVLLQLQLFVAAHQIILLEGELIYHLNQLDLKLLLLFLAFLFLKCLDKVVLQLRFPEQLAQVKERSFER